MICGVNIEKICCVGQNGEWWHTASSNNAADLATRAESLPSDISEGSSWQQGPEYLELKEDDWPINRDVVRKIVFL